MPTLELTLQRKTDSGYPVIAALTRPGGFLPLRREGMLTLDTAALAELQYEPLAYGTALGKALFVDEIRDTFREGLSDGEALRVLLSIEAPDLRALDWQRLAAPMDGGRWRFLASQQNTPFSLSVPSPASAHFPAIGRRDLRALLLVAGPESLSGDYKLAPFDVPATLASVQEALGDIPWDVLPNPSLDALCAALTATPYTILHLVCHGAVKESGETILFFPKDSKGSPTSASELLNRLGSLTRLPHFAFVSACESALPQNGLGSLAGRLVRELGLPAVLAMTDRVSIATANAIAAPFYAQLYQHGQPDLALAQSLAGLQGAHDLTVPAIFSRLGDRPLFDDNAKRALSDNELEFGLVKLAESLPERAPVMEGLREKLTLSLRSTLGADSKSLSDSRRTERKETLDQLNSLSLEALDLSFHALCLGQTPPAYDSRSPFRGLESFRPEDADYFFGRETLTRRLVQKLNEHNFLAILGASGSGKSSLVMAGLIPALHLPYAVFRPGAEPAAELEKALQSLPSPTGDGGEGLLVVDQFEELFTLSAREQRSEFISRLLEQSKRLRVVITLRADFLGEVAPFKSLKEEVENHQVIIPPMDEAELRRAMEGQAACAGLRFESDLSQQMLDDVSGEPGAMPLLQHALWTLWTRRHGRWLRADEYRAFGGVKQAIASTAEAVYARCSEFEKERLRDIFLRLTRLDEGADGRDTRRRVLLRDLIPADSDPESTKLLIKSLADARLVIVTGGDEAEVAHEALIRHWERLRAWLNDDRDTLRLREGVSDDARRWENANRDEALLNHRGARLELALAMSKNPRYRLNPTEQAYLDGCVALREREIKAKETLRRRILTGLATGLVIALVLAGFAVYQMSQAQRQTQSALARQLAAQAQALFTGRSSKPMTAVLLAIQSMQIFPTGEAAQILRNNTLARPVARMTHEGPVTAVAFSPDGRYALSAGCDGWGSSGNCIQGSARVWEAATGREVARMTHEDSVSAVAFSPDGRYALSGGNDGSARVWEAATGREVARMTHEGFVSAVAFSPDGRYALSGGNDGSARVWEAATGREVARMTHEGWVTAVAFSPDGRYALSAGCDGLGGIFCIQGSARVWEAATGREVARMTHEGEVYAVAFSPDGRYALSAGCDEQDSSYNCIQGSARVWEAATGREVARMTHNGSVNVVAFSPDGRYALSGGGDGSARVWEAASGREVARMTHEDWVSAVAFSPDGRYALSGSGDGSARVWEAATGREVARMTHENSVSAVAFSPDGRYALSGSGDGSARVWEAASGREVARMTHENYVSAVAFSPDGRYALSADENGSIRVWEAATGREVARMMHEGEVYAVAFSPDGRYALSGSGDGSARVWEAATGREVARMTHEKGVSAVAFSPDGRYALSAGCDGWNSSGVCIQGSARVWEAATGREVARMTHEDWVSAVAFSPDGRYALSGGNDGSARVWEAASGREIARMTHEGEVDAVAFSPDGRYALSAGCDERDSNGILCIQGSARVWEAASGREVARMTHEGEVYAVAFSPDGRYALSGSWGSARVWEAATGREVARMTHEGEVYAVAFSPDGRYALSGSEDGSARVWEAATGREVARMTHGIWVVAVAFSPDGRYALSGSFDGSVRVWLYRPEDLIAEACARVTRNLTRAEWQQYIGDALPYQAACPNLPIEP